MSITAKIEDGGKITLPTTVDWPSGSLVRVELVEQEGPTLWEGLKDFDSIASDLPKDLAENLDHRLHLF
jgi:hypothetical protein